MKRLGLFALLAAVLAAGLLLPDFQRQVSIGTGFVAKQMCSCMFVGGRSFESCLPDMLPMMDDIEAQVLSVGEGVRAWVPLLAERVARHQAPHGCTLEP
ncbi:MAG: hypothetical protein CL910_08385 [Deltaproteobacteria bacterium]|jgi:hypothetical protein|nr:hypothetical protein [Deltaproteobacteria bacterium]